MLFLQGFKQKNWAQLFIIFTRYLIGAAFVYASVVKIQGGRFTTVDGIEAPIDSAWYLLRPFINRDYIGILLGLANWSLAYC